MRSTLQETKRLEAMLAESAEKARSMRHPTPDPFFTVCMLPADAACAAVCHLVRRVHCDLLYGFLPWLFDYRLSGIATRVQRKGLRCGFRIETAERK